MKKQCPKCGSTLLNENVSCFYCRKNAMVAPAPVPTPQKSRTEENAENLERLCNQFPDWEDYLRENDRLAKLFFARQSDAWLDFLGNQFRETVLAARDRGESRFDASKMQLYRRHG